MSALKFAAGLLVFISAGTATAQEKTISTVRKAAIELLQPKLGSLRGSIKHDSEDIFLTEGMIMQLKPVRPGEHLAYQHDNPEKASTEPRARANSIDPTTVSSSRSAGELYRAIGLKSDGNS